MNKLKLEFQRRLRRFLPQLLIVLTAAVVWGHTVRFEFVWDDKFFIERLESIRSFKSIPEIFTSLAAQSSFPEGFVLFRPLRTVHYALLFQLGGGEPPKPWLFHLANVVWHGAAAVLFYSIALILFGKLAADEEEKSKAKLFALFTALAFTVNPVVSETVCWAKSLDDLMATAFTLAATLSLLRWSGDRRSYVLALGWFLLAVYSKISAVPFALFSFLLFYYFQRISFWRACRLASGFLAIALLFMVHNHLVVGRSSQTAPISGSYGQTLIDMLPVVPKYIRLLFGIPPFFIDYTYLKGGNAVLSAPVVTGLVLLLGIAAFCVWGLLKRGFPDPQRIEVSEGAAGREAHAPKFLLASLGLIW
ncbi:MAG TPA: hypothetical protein VFA77_13690, partial [Candidatus Eisenbacteria bacterium]|nr:hypothetical protein [Candidatus Eisenbacteria bacterium]